MLNNLCVYAAFGLKIWIQLRLSFVKLVGQAYGANFVLSHYWIKRQDHQSLLSSLNVKSLLFSERRWENTAKCGARDRRREQNKRKSCVWFIIQGYTSPCSNIIQNFDGSENLCYLPSLPLNLFFVTLDMFKSNMPVLWWNKLSVQSR